MTIKQNLTPVNFTRDGMREVRGIVIHSMWGTQAGSIAWFKNPKAQASAHYCISRDGEIVQTVLDKDMAWHAGVYDEPIPNWLKPNPNYYCIGIEFEDNRDWNWPYPEKQRQAGAWLVKQLMDKYGIPQNHVVLHRDLNPTRRSDPVGQFSFSWLFAGAGRQGTYIDADTFGKLVHNSLAWDETVKYLEIPSEPKDTSFEEVKSRIAGLKSAVTTCQGDLSKAQEEVKNREEQVSRLKDKMLEKEKLHKAEVKRLNEVIKTLNKSEGSYKSRIEVLEGQIDALAKQKGEIKLELADVKAKLTECQRRGTESYSSYDLVFLLLRRLIRR